MGVSLVFPLFFFSFFCFYPVIMRVCVCIAFGVFNFKGDAYFYLLLFFTLGSQALTSGHWRLYATSCKKLDADR